MKTMKTLGVMIAAGLLASAAFAQTTAPATSKTPEEKAQMKDMRHDIRAYNKEKGEAKHAINKGNLAAAKTDLAAAKTDKQDIKADAKVLKSEGVDHPVKLANKQVKKVDEKAVKTDLKDIHADKVAERKAVKAGDIATAKADKKEIKADKKDLKREIREARRDGIKHPVRRAK
jgi:hypothetical protein